MSIFLDGLHQIHSFNIVNSSLHCEEESSSLETTCPNRVSSLYVGRTRITQKWVTRIWTDPYTMACVLFPNQRERKIAVSEVISLMESLTLPWDQSSTQKLVLEIQERQMTYCKIQEMVPLQDKIKEDKRIRIKDSNKDNVNHQSSLIGNQS